MFTYMWTVDTAILFCQELEACLLDRWHVFFGGGVLYNGFSFHDLDIVLIPHTTNQAFYEDITFGLLQMGLKQIDTYTEKHIKWQENGSNDRKLVESWLTSDFKRVDIIMMGLNVEVKS